MKVWESFLTEQDRKVYQASGYAAKAELGRRPAIVVIDVNYAFCGHVKEPLLDSLKTWRNSCGEKAWEAIPHIQTLLKEAREKRIPVFYTTGQDRRPDGFDAGGWTRKNNRSGGPEGVPEFPRNRIVEEIAPIESDIVIRKPKPSAFFGTALNGYLIDLGVDSLLLCGTTTSGCVRATCLDAFSLNYKVAVVEECTFDRLEASHAMALFDMNHTYADIYGIEETVSYLRSVETGLYDHRIDFSAQTEASLK